MGQGKREWVCLLHQVDSAEYIDLEGVATGSRSIAFLTSKGVTVVLSE